MRLTIFLDIDGVLNHEPVTEDCGNTLEKVIKNMKSGFDRLCSKCIDRLNQLVSFAYSEARYNKVCVVCSSTWRRRFSPKELGEILSLKGFHYEIDGHTAINDKRRGQQILDYIKECSTDAFIVLDDDTFYMDLIKDNQVVTNYRSGFDDKALTEAFKLTLEMRDK